MLNLVLMGLDIPTRPLVRDVEWKFNRITDMNRTPVKEAMLAEVERGSWGDERTFVDRFGVNVYLENLSTGCKAGFVVDAFPDFCIDLAGCGNNAVEAIIAHCKEGEVLTRIPTWTLRTEGDCDVLCLGRRFTTMAELSDYLERGGYSGI